MDILATPHIVRWMSEIPEWTFTPPTSETSIKQGEIEKQAADGRTLHVEALRRVFGLDDEDLKAVVELKFHEHRFLTLDPVALLKAKCANVNELMQGDGERHDETHLKLLGRCLPAYLRQIAGNVATGQLKNETACSTLNRLFATLCAPAYGGILWHADLTPDTLVPAEFATTPNEAIRELYSRQMPKAREACNPGNYAPKYKPRQAHAPALSPAGRRKGRTLRHL